MPRGKRQTPKEDAPTIDAPPQSGPDNGSKGSGPNYCTDDIKRQAYKEALILDIAVKSAQATAKSKLGAYRAYLKEAGKKGVSTESITNALKKRFNDPELVLIEEREKLKMLDLCGFLPGIRERLLERMDVQEPTAKEEEENQVLIAYDRGHFAGRSGHLRDTNPYEPGTLGHVKFVDGYLSGQRAIADEMAPDVDDPASDAWVEQPSAPARHSPLGDPMPGEMPPAVH